MTGPAWLSAGAAVLMLLIAVSTAARLVIGRLRRRHTEPDTDSLHILMGVAMAGMLEPRLSPVPDAAWTVLFAAAATWFTWHTIRAHARGQARGWHCAHPAPHVVECAAMIYMLLPGRAAGHAQAMTMPGMPGPATANPAVALLLALFMLGYIVWTTDQLIARSPAKAASAPKTLTGGTRNRHGRGAAPAAGRAVTPASLGAAMLAPRLAAFYKIVMSVAMGYMLVTML